MRHTVSSFSVEEIRVNIFEENVNEVHVSLVLLVAPDNGEEVGGQIGDDDLGEEDVPEVLGEHELGHDGHELLGELGAYVAVVYDEVLEQHEVLAPGGHLEDVAVEVGLAEHEGEPGDGAGVVPHGDPVQLAVAEIIIGRRDVFSFNIPDDVLEFRDGDYFHMGPPAQHSLEDEVGVVELELLQAARQPVQHFVVVDHHHALLEHGHHLGVRCLGSAHCVIVSEVDHCELGVGIFEA